MATRKGRGILIDPDLAHEVHMDTIQCVHCGGHWIPVQGSGKVRGFCAKCNGPFCGPACAECIPAEQFIELLEEGLHPHHVDTTRFSKQVYFKDGLFRTD